MTAMLTFTNVRMVDLDRGVLTESTGKSRNRVWQHRGIFEVLDGYAEKIRRMSVR